MWINFFHTDKFFVFYFHRNWFKPYTTWHSLEQLEGGNCCFTQRNQKWTICKFWFFHLIWWAVLLFKFFQFKRRLRMFSFSNFFLKSFNFKHSYILYLHEFWSEKAQIYFKIISTFASILLGGKLRKKFSNSGLISFNISQFAIFLVKSIIAIEGCDWAMTAMLLPFSQVTYASK